MLFILLGLAVAAGGTALPDQLAVRIHGEGIHLSTIDAPLHEKIEELHARLLDQAARTVELLIDEQLAKTSVEPIDASPKSITEQAVREFRSSRVEEFEGPLATTEAAGKPAVGDEAIRQSLEQESVAVGKAGFSRRLRAGHRIRLELPDASELERPLPAQRPVAEVDGLPIRAAALERTAALALYRLRKEIYLERQNHIAAVIEDRLLTREARRRGLSVETLVADSARNITVSDAEVNDFIEKARASGREVADPEPVRQYLVFLKAYDRHHTLLEKLRKNAHIEILLVDPQPPLLPLMENDAPALGATKGARLIVYTNYRCAPCRSTHREIDRLLAAEAKVRVVFRDFIPAYDPVAKEAARLTRCAARLGEFARMRSELLARDPPPFGGSWYDKESLRGLTARLEIDASAFGRCLDADDIREAIARDTAEARGFGFEEAPSFVVQGMPLSGMQSAESLAALLRQGREAPRKGGARHNRR